jgi:hypothetical protein
MIDQDALALQVTISKYAFRLIQIQKLAGQGCGRVPETEVVALIGEA